MAEHATNSPPRPPVLAGRFAEAGEGPDVPDDGDAPEDGDAAGGADQSSKSIRLIGPAFAGSLSSFGGAFVLL